MRKLAIILLASAAAVPMASAAQAADLMAPMAPPAAVAAAPATTNWQGAYIGANAGYGWGTVTSGSGTLTPSGFTGGGQVGYNFYLTNSFVLGVQGDVDYNNFQSNNGAYGDSMDWTGAITGHIGYAFDSFMPYALGGVAFANNNVTSAAGVTQSQVHTGYTVGGGAEVMLADNLSAFAEYRYSDYGAMNYTTAGIAGVHPTDSTVRVGLNFHF